MEHEIHFSAGWDVFCPDEDMLPKRCSLRYISTYCRFSLLVVFKLVPVICHQKNEKEHLTSVNILTDHTPTNTKSIKPVQHQTEPWQRPHTEKDRTFKTDVQFDRQCFFLLFVCFLTLSAADWLWAAGTLLSFTPVSWFLLPLAANSPQVDSLIWW